MIIIIKLTTPQQEAQKKLKLELRTLDYYNIIIIKEATHNF